MDFAKDLKLNKDKAMNLTTKEAYKAMFSFMSEYYFKNKDNPEAFCDLLSNMQTFPFYKYPIDGSIWPEWEKAIKKAKNNEVKILAITNKKTIEKYRKEFNLSDDVDPDQF